MCAVTLTGLLTQAKGVLGLEERVGELRRSHIVDTVKTFQGTNQFRERYFNTNALIGGSVLKDLLRWCGAPSNYGWEVPVNSRP